MVGSLPDLTIQRSTCRAIVFNAGGTIQTSLIAFCLLSSELAVHIELGEEGVHRLLHRNSRLPAQAISQLLVRIPHWLPLGRATTAVEGRRKLAL